MFEISVLKEMKLSELQEIAKAANITKITGVKKEALINQILEVQASFSGDTSEAKFEKTNDAKPKRARITVDKKAESMSLFSESADKVEENQEAVNDEAPAVNPKERKVVKFKKADFEAKVAAKAATETISESDNAEQW
jgi:transcription termination factor Rho